MSAMNYKLALVSFVSACGAAGHGASPASPTPHVDVYAAEESNVNAYVLSDDAGTVVIDATRSSAAARDVVALARSRGAAPSVLFVTHGHPDHFLGMGEMKREVPGLRIVVATQAIKDDVVGFATWMDGQGWLEQEPAMKPRSDAHPDGFDYQGAIEVLASPRLVLPGGESLVVDTDFPATEAAHETTLYSPELGALFTGDLAYDKVHLWLGVGVSREDARAWQSVTRTLEARYPAGTRVYPGHGAPTDLRVFASVRSYIDDLLAAASSASDEAASDQMVKKYPDWANRDFLLKMSVANQRALAK
jgi:glyoxylase-like metal-dependent hydrolase (beta-lactamase superfamily II)